MTVCGLWKLRNQVENTGAVEERFGVALESVSFTLLQSRPVSCLTFALDCSVMDLSIDGMLMS